MDLNALCDVSSLNKEQLTEKFDINIDIKVADSNHVIAASIKK